MRLLAFIICSIVATNSVTMGATVTAYINGEFGSADTIGGTSVAGESFRIEMVFSTTATPDEYPEDGRGWFFGDSTTITSQTVGQIDVFGNTFLDVINNLPGLTGLSDPNAYWFGLDTDPGGGIAAFYNSRVFGDPDEPALFGPLEPTNGFQYSLNGVNTSLGQLTSLNDGNVTAAGLSAVPEPNSCAVLAMGSFACLLLRRKRRS